MTKLALVVAKVAEVPGATVSSLAALMLPSTVERSTLKRSRALTSAV